MLVGRFISLEQLTMRRLLDSACAFAVQSFLLPRDAMLSAVCYANSVRLPSVSVTCVYCFKTAERIIEILSRSNRPVILVFSH